MAKAGEKQQKETQTQEDRNQGTQQRSEAQSSAGQSQTSLSPRRQSMPSLFVNPFSFMRWFGGGMEQLLGEFGSDGLAPRGFAEWAPQIEMFQREGQLYADVDWRFRILKPPNRQGKQHRPPALAGSVC